MPMFRKLTALVGTAVAVRAYVKRNPDKVNNMAAKTGEFIDKRTKGKYHGHIDTALNKVHDATRSIADQPRSIRTGPGSSESF